MQLFDDIVTLLSDETKSLTSALLKTRVLMHRIGHKDIDGWLACELNGYPKDAQIPNYRIVGANVIGTVENIAKRYNNVTLPTLHLPEVFRERFNRAHLAHSVAELESFAVAKEGSVASAIPPELYGMMSKPYDGDFSVTSAKSVIGSTSIKGVLVEIRSRLLEFVLSLQDKIGDVPEGEMKKAAEGLNTGALFQSAVFGSNTTIVVGSQNRTTVNNTATQGDISQLRKVLRDAGIGESDLATLDQAIEDDGDAPHRTKTLGPRVAEWIGNMLQRAATGALQIGLNTAGTLLTSEISNYYGLGSS
ncbi:AbiTii domain-containing protein [Burkholderia cepacia]|nr:hypothetical protein [Burkholderia cepacia]AIO25763.1 response regulator [Burkholderia cepacia ATCC 25416]SPV07596.1 response regulator [Burkholderia cepacia]